MNKDKSRGKQFKGNKKKDKKKYLEYKLDHLKKQKAAELDIANTYARSKVFDEKERKLLKGAALEKVKEIEDRTAKTLKQYRRLVD